MDLEPGLCKPAACWTSSELPVLLSRRGTSLALRLTCFKEDTPLSGLGSACPDCGSSSGFRTEVLLHAAVETAAVAMVTWLRTRPVMVSSPGSESTRIQWENC